MNQTQIHTLYEEMNVNRVLIANLYQHLGFDDEDFFVLVREARDTLKNVMQDQEPGGSII